MLFVFVYVSPPPMFPGVTPHIPGIICLIEIIGKRISQKISLNQSRCELNPCDKCDSSCNTRAYKLLR